MAIRVPPDSFVDVYVLDEEGNQQVNEEQELEEQAPVQGELRDTTVADRLRGDEGGDRWGRQTDRSTVPVPEASPVAAASSHQCLQRRQC